MQKINFHELSTIGPERSSVSVSWVAVLREEGTNGDREMVSALLQAGFCVHDLTMSDLLSGGTSLQGFRGVVFPGGFSYAGKLCVCESKEK